MNSNRFAIFRSLTLLRQLSLHAGLIDEAHAGLASAKIDALLGQLQEVTEGGHRALVFLISLKAGRFGLNLAEADYCFLLDPWWNPATETQAAGSAARRGSERRSWDPPGSRSRQATPRPGRGSRRRGFRRAVVQRPVVVAPTLS